MGLRGAGGVVMALMLAACAGAPLPAQNSMSGHWKLSAPNAPFCDMNFEGEPGADQGAILPDGGCPGEMFKSRNWVLAQNALTIGDDQNHPLATLKLTGSRFEGTSASGMPVALTR
jgi:Protease inhibitor Inh